MAADAPISHDQNAFQVPDGIALAMAEDADFARGSADREEIFDRPRRAVDPAGIQGGDPEVARAPAELERLDAAALVADEHPRQLLVNFGLGHDCLIQMLYECYIPPDRGKKGGKLS